MLPTTPRNQPTTPKNQRIYHFEAYENKIKSQKINPLIYDYKDLYG